MIDRILTKAVKDVNDWHETVIKVSSEIWKGEKDWVPMLHLLCKIDGEYCHEIYVIPGDREFFHKIIDVVVDKRPAIGLVLVTEAWMKTFEEKPSREIRENLNIAEDPDRVEVLALNIETKYKAELVFFPIKRPNDAKPYLDKRHRRVQTIEGRLAHLLAEEPKFNLN